MRQITKKVRMPFDLYVSRVYLIIIYLIKNVFGVGQMDKCEMTWFVVLGIILKCWHHLQT